MSDDETQPVTEPAAAVPPQPEPHPAPYAPAYAAAPAPRSRRGGLLFAGLALAIALVAGTAGFALGNVTADDGRDGPMSGQGGPFGHFGGDGHAPGGFGQGQPPSR